jgi:lipoprotein-anchoring transpeptidase ErfK/SrfK
MEKNRKFIHILIISAVLFLTFEAAGYYFGASRVTNGDTPKTRITKNNKIKLPALKGKNAALRQKLRSLTPQEIYIVVDTGRNRLFLKRGDRIVREAVISCGSGSVLKDPSGKRQWTFDTPRGEHQVKSKYVAPAWIKPDWAFIEEAEAIPKDPKERVEEGVLGDYALGFGNGYFIHGTLYTRLLGRNVTHGCIRVGDQDLKTIFTTAGIGTKIYIF